MKEGCSIFLILMACLVGVSQNPDVSFEFEKVTACINENISFSNTSSDVSSYEWDFCSGGVSSTPTGGVQVVLSELNNSFGIELVETGGNYYGFVANTNSSELIRLDFGTDYTSIPDVFSLGDLGFLVKPTTLSFRQFDGDWVCFLGDEETGLLRINFGSDITNSAPIVNEFTALIEYSKVQPVRDIEVVYENGGYKVLATGNNSTGTISITDFGSDLTGDVLPLESSFSVTSGANNLQGIAFYSNSEDWYGLAVDFRDGLYRLSFGASINSTVSVTPVSGVTNGVKVETIHDKGRWYGVVTSSDANQLYRVDLGLDIVIEEPSVSVVGDLGILNRAQAFGVIRAGNAVILKGINRSTNELVHVEFPLNCTGSLGFDTTSNPKGLSYSSAGKYGVVLTGTSANGDGVVSAIDTVEVDDFVAPDISFTVDESRCVSNANTFNSINESGNIVSYSWDFDNDGSEDNTDSNPTYQFSEVGNYMVRLEVINNNGCRNFKEQELVIYPEPPMPDFDYSDVNLCTNNELVFTNLTDETGFSEVISYLWDLNGEPISMDKNPALIFTTTGNKQVGLMASIPGCTTAVYSEVLAIDEGPVPRFKYSNNCGIGSEVEFINESEGSVVEYEWDFGDGESTSSDENPIFIFGDLGEVDVSLIVTNSSGCSSEYVESITVRDGTFADFIFNGADQNIPIEFTGLDSSFFPDSIIDWSWDFGGLGTSILQSPNYTFLEPDDYLVVMDVVTAQGCTESVEKTVTVSYGCPNIAFSPVPKSPVCIGEHVSFTNTSINVSSYFWDFCSGGLESTPTGTVQGVLPELNNSFGMELIEAGGSYYGFVANTNSSELLRLDFGDDYTSLPDVVNLGDLGFLIKPITLSFRQFDGNWICFIGDEGTGLLRLNFGSEITNSTPIVNEFLNLVEYDNIQPVRDLEVVYENGGYKVLATGNNGTGAISITDFGSDLAGEMLPTETNFIVSSAANNLQGIGFYSNCENWYGLAVDFTDGLYSISFGATINSAPTVTPISGISSGVKLETIHDKGRWYGLVTSSDTDQLYRVDLGFDVAPDEPTVSALGDLGVLDRAQAFGVTRIGSTIVLEGINRSTNELVHVEFPSICSGSFAYDMSSSPTGFSYSSAGKYGVVLTGTSANGDGILSTIDTVEVNSFEAPDITFSMDESRCVANANTFTAINESADITAYSWDFNGDGVEDSSDPTSNHQFTTPGTYEIALDVQSAACANHTRQTLTVFPEPPTPSFEFSSGQICPETEVVFANLTEDSPYDGQLQYHWSITDLGDTITSGDVMYAFAFGGEKDISVYTSVPGCESTVVTDAVTIEELPAVDFQVNAVCEGDVTVFNEQSEGVSFQWDFKDGFVSTEQNPEHLYAAPGSYQVVLSILGANGCANVVTKEVVVSSVPEPAFQYDILCEGSEITLRDVSVVEGSDIIDRKWYLDGVLVASEQNAVISFDSNDENLLRLVVTATNGCEASYSESLNVLPQPVVTFTGNIACLGETSTFLDTSDGQQQLMARTWAVNGQVLPQTDQEVSYVFDQPGTYEITLTIDNNNLCTGVQTMAVEVYALPSPAFSVTGFCENETISVQDLTENVEDAISTRSWYLNGEVVGNGPEALLPVTQEGSYEVTLEIGTTNGCSISQSQIFDVFASPDAGFSPSNDYGVPPFVLDFTNTSTNSVSYEWYVNDEMVSTDMAPSIAFAELGDQDVKLRTLSDEGCFDSASMTILSVVPTINLSVENMQLVDGESGKSVLLNVSNQSNLPVESLVAEIRLENEFTLSETIAQRINVGENEVISLNVNLPLTSSLGYLCVSLSSVYDVMDESPEDNERCVNVLDETFFEPIYPNPTTGYAYIRAILPEQGDVKFTVVNVAGQVEEEIRMEDQPSGLNTFTIDLLAVGSGTYFVVVEYAGKTYKNRIIKK